VYCSFAYVKKIPQFLLIQLKYKLKGGKNGFTGLESDGFSVLILRKTAPKPTMHVLNLQLMSEFVLETLFAVFFFDLIRVNTLISCKT
jgi:hypothetical protein